MINLGSITDAYILNEVKTHDLMRKAAKATESLASAPFPFLELTSEDLQPYRKKHVLYFFKIANSNVVSSPTICEQIESLKSDPTFESKLPKVNMDNANTGGSNNPILYVGKSSGYFNTRLKQHLGNESKHTYALHLKRWAQNEVLSQVKLELFHATVDVERFGLEKKEGHAFLEKLENGLHRYLKPILGRSGH